MTTLARASIYGLVLVLTALTGCASNAPAPDAPPRQDLASNDAEMEKDGEASKTDSDMTRPTETPKPKEEDVFGGAVKIDDNDSAFAADTTSTEKKPVVEANAGPAAPPAKPQFVIGTPLVVGELDRNDAENRIRRQEKAIKACFDDYLAKNGAAGDMMVSFAVKPAGTLDNLAIAKSTIKDKAIEACVIKAFSTIVFPVRKNTKPILVQFPLLLSVP